MASDRPSAPPAAPPEQPREPREPGEEPREPREEPQPQPRESRDARVKRPRYLVVALIGAMIFGAGCWTEGCSRLTFYRGERDVGATLNAAIKSDVDRGHAESLYQRFTDAADEGRNRAIPMAAATFVLGAALLAFAARGLAGKTRSRNVLVQIVTAQAVVVALSYFVTRNVRNAELDWEFEMQLIGQHERLPPDQYEQVVPMMQSMRIVVPPGWLILRTIASGLIVLALTRPRSREFFEAAGKTVSPER